MKKTTYIIFGMYGTGFVLILCFIIYLSATLTKTKDVTVDFGPATAGVPIPGSEPLEIGFNTTTVNDTVQHHAEYLTFENMRTTLTIRESNGENQLKVPAELVPFVKIEHQKSSTVVTIDLVSYVRARYPKQNPTLFIVNVPNLGLDLSSDTRTVMLQSSLRTELNSIHRDSLNLLGVPIVAANRSRLKVLQLSDPGKVFFNQSEIDHLLIDSPNDEEYDDYVYLTDEQSSHIGDIAINGRNVYLERNLKFESLTVTPTDSTGTATVQTRGTMHIKGTIH